MSDPYTIASVKVVGDFQTIEVAEDPDGLGVIEISVHEHSAGAKKERVLSIPHNEAEVFIRTLQEMYQLIKAKEARDELS